MGSLWTPGIVAMISLLVFILGHSYNYDHADNPTDLFQYLGYCIAGIAILMFMR
jgi:hypothetical protein